MDRASDCGSEGQRFESPRGHMKLLSLLITAIALTIFTSSAVLAQDIITAEKMIVVDIGKQKVFVWENGQLLKEIRVSTGMLYEPTVKGSFKVQRKVAKKDMKGQSKRYGKYHIKDVPYILYFYQGYAIHGTYWHNKFGSRASHGCVNLPVSEAEWLYNWANIGTRVEVF